MKKLILLLAVLLLAVAACAKQEAPATQNTPPAPIEQVQTTTTEVPVVKEKTTTEVPSAPTLTEEQVKAADASMRSQDRIGLSPGFKKVKAGDEVVVAVAVANKLVNTETFKVSVEYKSARDKYSASVSEDKNFATAWVIGNQFPLVDVAPNQKQYMPLVIKVGNTVDGTTPPPATYTFVVKVETKDGQSFDSYATKDMVVVVE